MKNKTALCLIAGSVWVLAATACGDSEPNDDPGTGAAGTSSAGASGSGNNGSSAGGSGNGAAGEGSNGDSGGSSATGGTSNAGKGGSGGSAGNGGTQTAGNGGSNAGGTNNSGSGGDAGDTGSAGDGNGEGGAGGNDEPSLFPILEYHFDEGEGTLIGDDSPRELDATLSDPNAWDAVGRNGCALSLSGGNPPTQFAELPNGVFSGVEEATIAVWVKLRSNTIWNRVFDFGNSSTGEAERFMYLTPNSPEGIRFSVFGGTAQNEATVVTNTTLPNDVWKHLAATVAANGEHVIYIDGFPAAKTFGPYVPLSELEPIVGKAWLGKSRFPDAGFDGLIDDFIVYERVLNHTEIAELAWPKSDYSRLRFDEGSGTESIDSSDRGVDATLHGATWTTGRLGAAVELSGAEQYVSLDSNPLAGCTNELTVALWVKLDEATPWTRIFDFGNDSQFIYLTTHGAKNSLHFAMYKGDETAVSAPDNVSIPTDGAWHHVAVVVSPSAATLYLDGASVGTTATVPALPGDFAPLTQNYLGKSWFDPDPYLNGALDELRISCRAYTPDEIKNLAFK